VDKAGEVLRVGQGEGWVMGSERERAKSGESGKEGLRVGKAGGERLRVWKA
jgi:hypothetical protein